VPIEVVELHPRNPHIGDVEAVTASLRRFGQQKPIVVQQISMRCVAGNHVLRAARSLAWSEIAANVVALSDASAVAFLLTDNRTSDFGRYDDALLAAILAEQAAADNLDATGYDPDDVEALLRAAGRVDERDPDAVPDLPPEAKEYVQPGDLWALGRHRLLVGDATDPASVAADWPALVRSAIGSDGQALWPELWPVTKLEEKRRELGSAIFNLHTRTTHRAWAATSSTGNGSNM
jgi:ParB-like chromosome segregation protein Spo0J